MCRFVLRSVCRSMSRTLRCAVYRSVVCGSVDESDGR